MLGGVDGMTENLSILNSISNIVALACLSSSSAANYVCGTNGHSKELGMLGLDFMEGSYSLDFCDYHLS